MQKCLPVLWEKSACLRVELISLTESQEMRSFQASVHINSAEKQRDGKARPLSQLQPSGVAAGRRRIHQPPRRPRTRSFNPSPGNKGGAHTDLIDLSVGAISHHFHQLENPSRILEEKEGRGEHRKAAQQ